MSITKMVHLAEIQTGYQFSGREIEAIAKHTRRKCRRVGKDKGYFSILFQNELRDYMMGKAVNAGIYGHERSE